MLSSDGLANGDEWLQLLEGAHPSLGPQGEPRASSRSRSRSPPRASSSMSSGLLEAPLQQVTAWSEEEMAEEVGRLNVIVPTPDDDEDRQRLLLLERWKQVARSASSSSPVVITSQGDHDGNNNSRSPLPSLGLRAAVAMTSSSAASAAASRVCRDLFGSSSSLFYQGALMSHYFKGSALSHGLVSSLVDSLPARLKLAAFAQLQQLSQIPVVQLMPLTSHNNAVHDAEARVTERLKPGLPAAEFYIGISERPQERFVAHQGNGFNKFWVYMFTSSVESGSAEKALIHRLKPLWQCLNVGAGCERASQGQPHYLYIAWKPASTQYR